MIGIDVLVNEHQNIVNFTNIIEEKMINILDGEKIDTDYFRKAIEFIRRYADGHHHQKEEDVLFDKMLEELGAVAEKLIRFGMLIEHDQARFTVNEWEKALDSFDEDPTTKNKLDIISQGMNYVYLLRRHASKENTVLYPFAEKNLSEESKKWINEETQKLEKNKEDFSDLEEFFID